MPTKTHDRTSPLLIIAIILIHANLQGTLSSPAYHREELVVRTSLAEAARQGEAHNLRYYHANPSTLRTSTVDSNHVLPLAGMAAPGGAGGRVNNGMQQAVPEGVVRIVRRATTGLDRSEEDVDYDYRQQMYTDGISSASLQPLPSRKRAFSVLARWKPFTNISKLRVSSRQQQLKLLRPIIAQQQAQAHAQQMLSGTAHDYDVISAETRALLLRPSGQPLRNRQKKMSRPKGLATDSIPFSYIATENLDGTVDINKIPPPNTIVPAQAGHSSERSRRSSIVSSIKRSFRGKKREKPVKCSEHVNKTKEEEDKRTRPNKKCTIL